MCDGEELHSLLYLASKDVHHLDRHAIRLDKEDVILIDLENLMLLEKFLGKFDHLLLRVLDPRLFSSLCCIFF